MRRATLIKKIGLDEQTHARSGTHLRAEISQDKVLKVLKVLYDLGVTQVLSACIIQFIEVLLHNVRCPLQLEKQILALFDRYICS